MYYINYKHNMHFFHTCWYHSLFCCNFHTFIAPTSTSTSSNTGHLKIPKFDLPKFNGQYKGCTLFYEQFLASVQLFPTSEKSFTSKHLSRVKPYSHTFTINQFKLQNRFEILHWSLKQWKVHCQFSFRCNFAIGTFTKWVSCGITTTFR